MQNLDKLISELKKTKESLKADKKEPHKDDPKHEQKEQEKAKKIKKETQSLLDLHKEEMDKGEPNGAMPSPAPSAEPTAPSTNGAPPVMKSDEMDKADSTSPEQQKANRERARKEGNVQAKKWANIKAHAPKETPAEVKPAQKDSTASKVAMHVVSGSGKPGGQSPNPKLVAKAQDVFDSLIKSGHTESALLLRNWGEEDSLAKSCRAELEKTRFASEEEEATAQRERKARLDYKAGSVDRVAGWRKEREAKAEAKNKQFHNNSIVDVTRAVTGKGYDTTEHLEGGGGQLWHKDTKHADLDNKSKHSGVLPRKQNTKVKDMESTNLFHVEHDKKSEKLNPVGTLNPKK